MLTSRARVQMALNHQEADRVPFDMGGSAVTGMHVSTVYHLRQALGLDAPECPVKVVEPYQMLGEIGDDLRDALGIDVVGLSGRKTMFGFMNENWKPWQTFDGTPVLVPEHFNTVPEVNGDILMYPEGDRSAPPSGRMPRGGWFFDAICRQEPIDDEHLNVEDNLAEFSPVAELELEHFRTEVVRLYATDKAILANFGGTAFGDIALVPAPWLKQSKGIRDIEEWYVSTLLRPDYIRAVFEYQCSIGIENLARIYSVVGNRITAVFITGTDFGTQKGPFISPDTYRSLYKPFHTRVNDWVHTHTQWKTFIHSCGSIVELIPDLIDAGFDIFNPIQCSAAGMDPKQLKQKFGDRITFWGGSVDTQHTLPFGTPGEVRNEVCKRIGIFAPGGGYVFNAIHNIQAATPIENVLAMIASIHEFGVYPIQQ